MRGGGGITGPTELKALATGVANQVTISWAAVNGADGYTLYQSTDNLSGFANGNPDNLAAANPAAGSSTFSGTVTSTAIVLSGVATNYFLVTATQGGVESLTSAQTAATAHPLTFNIVAGGGTGTFWMDRNLGAADVASNRNDTTAYGDLYQFGRPADGHQVLANTDFTATLSATISPGHAEFITTTAAPNDWTAAGVDTDGAQRQAFWSRIDGSGICPTGFRVPTRAELLAELGGATDDSRAIAFANIKLTIAGSRLTGGILFGTGSNGTGNYWINAINGDNSIIIASNPSFQQASLGTGLSVRCIQN